VRVMKMKYEFLADEWFNGRTCVGAVAIKSHNGWKAYIGAGKGFDIDADKYAIASHGCKLKREIALAIFSRLNPDEFDDAW